MKSRKELTDVSWGPAVQDITGRGNSPGNTVFTAVQVTNDELHVTVRTSAYQKIDEYTMKK